jgi:hypothetical protein
LDHSSHHVVTRAKRVLMDLLLFIPKRTLVYDKKLLLMLSDWTNETDGCLKFKTGVTDGCKDERDFNAA